MTFLIPAAAEVGGWTLRKVLPWILFGLVLAGLGAALWVQTVRLDAAKATLQGVQHDRDIQAADAKRWAGSAGQMQKVIDEQAAQLKQHAADLVKAQRVADETTQAQAIEISTLTNELETMKARAHAHPDQVRPLGPIVADVLSGMHGKANRPSTPSTSD